MVSYSATLYSCGSLFVLFVVVVLVAFLLSTVVFIFFPTPFLLSFLSVHAFLLFRYDVYLSFFVLLFLLFSLFLSSLYILGEHRKHISIAFIRECACTVLTWRLYTSHRSFEQIYFQSSGRNGIKANLRKQSHT